MRRPWGRAAGAAVIFGTTCAGGSSAPGRAGPSPSLEEEVRARTEVLLDGYRRGDPKAMATVFAEDAIIQGGGLTITGRVAIEDYWARRPRVSSWTIGTEAVGGGDEAPWQIARSTRIIASADRIDTTVTPFVAIWRRGPDRKLYLAYDIFDGTPQAPAKP